MTVRWLRLRPGRAENARAAALAVGVGAGLAAVIFYLARLVFAREEVARPRREADGSTPSGALARREDAPGRAGRR